MQHTAIVYNLISSGHQRIGINQGQPAVYVGGPVLLDAKLSCHKDLLDAKPSELEEYLELAMQEFCGHTIL